jgi:hypothetical protein
MGKNNIKTDFIFVVVAYLKLLSMHSLKVNEENHIHVCPGSLVEIQPGYLSGGGIELGCYVK